MEKENKYYGSYICLTSCQLFLIALIYNYNWGNYFLSLVILASYIVSCIYHYYPTLQTKYNDEVVARILVCVTCVSSLYRSNIFPTRFTLLLAYMYYNRPNFVPNTYIDNLYHSICSHMIAFFGLMALYYNNTQSNNYEDIIEVFFS